jgi:hypothetical protein
MTVSPAYGNKFVSPTLTTSAPCPVGSDNFYIRLYGGAPGSQMPDLGQQMKEPGSLEMSTSQPFSVQTAFNFIDTASDAGVATLAGDYVLELVCQTELSSILRTFTTPLTFQTETRPHRHRPPRRLLRSQPSSPRDHSWVTPQPTT